MRKIEAGKRTSVQRTNEQTKGTVADGRWLPPPFGDPPVASVVALSGPELGFSAANTYLLDGTTGDKLMTLLG